MKFLFVAKQQKNAEAFLATLKAVIERGHDVTIAVQEWDDERDRRFEEAINSPRLKVLPCPSARMDEWRDVAPLVRRLRDSVHILQPAFTESSVLRLRILDKLRQELALDATSDTLERELSTIAPSQLQRIESVLRLAERAIPTSELFDEFLRSEAPDVLLISPLVHFGSAQADVAASGRRLGIPVWMLMFSWDNLSTKGSLHVLPDLMFVWNERQRQEAEQLHRFPASRVVVTGAARFDGFFDLQPRMTHAQFHEGLGLDPAKPTLLYLCSSRLIVPEELPFIRRWLGGLRGAASGVLRGCNVIVRPHPDLQALGGELQFERCRWPGAPDLGGKTARPFDDAGALVLRTSYKEPFGLYESLAHSTAVVGLNTTAELEAGIAGRPVFTIHPDATGDEGPRPTVHFHYLTREHGGFVSSASSIEEHLSQLAAALAAAPEPAPIRSFIESFLRPLGIDRPVSPLLAEELLRRAEGTARLPPRDREMALPETDDAPQDESDIPLADEAERIVVGPSPGTGRDVENQTVRLEQSVVKWLEQWVKVGEVVYDLDAGFGAYTLIAARQRGAVVVAFEPGYGAYAALCDNVRLNGCQGVVIPLPFAIGSSDSLAAIKYERDHPGGPRHAVLKTRWRARAADAVQPHVHSVCTTRLDTAVELYGLPPAHHIRIARGLGALEVLEGAGHTLAHPACRSVWLHAPPGDEALLVARFQTAGFHPVVRRDRRKSIQLVFVRDEASNVADGSTQDRREAASRQP